MLFSPCADVARHEMPVARPEMPVARPFISYPAIDISYYIGGVPDGTTSASAAMRKRRQFIYKCNPRSDGLDEVIDRYQATCRSFTRLIRKMPHELDAMRHLINEAATHALNNRVAPSIAQPQDLGIS